MPVLAPFGSSRSGKLGQIPRWPILGTITDLVATVGDTQVTLAWSQPVGATHFQRQYKEAAEETWLDYGEEVSYPAPLLQVIDGLTNTVSHNFRVISYDPVGASTISNTDTKTPATAAGWGTITDNLITDETDTTLEGSFDQVADDAGNPSKYWVAVGLDPLTEDNWDERIDEVAIDTNLEVGVAKTYQFTGLTPGTDYETLARPFRGLTGAAEAWGPWSNSAPGTTTGTPATLGTITNLTGFSGDGQVTLQWSSAANATSHQPEYKLASSETWLQFESPLGGTANTVTVDGLNNDDPYDFRIVAGDGTTTTNSNEIERTPTAPVGGLWPNLPAGLTSINEFDVHNETPRRPVWGEMVGGRQYFTQARFGEVVVDSPPSGNNRSFRAVYSPPGWAGSAACLLRNTAWHSTVGKRLYQGVICKWSDGWVQNPGGTKNCFTIFDENSGNMYTGAEPGRKLGHGFQIPNFVTGYREFGPTIQDDTWYRIELLLTFSATIPGGTMRVELWLSQWTGSAWGTPTKTDDYTRDHEIAGEGVTLIRSLEGTWGGGFGALSATQYLYWDRATTWIG